MYMKICPRTATAWVESSQDTLFSASMLPQETESLKIMEVMLEKKESLKKLADEVEIYPQVLKNVRVHDKKTAQDDPDVQAEVQKVSDALGDTGRILLRQSGTEPVVRVMVEAETDAICEKYVDQVIEVMKAKGHVI